MLHTACQIYDELKIIVCLVGCFVYWTKELRENFLHEVDNETTMRCRCAIEDQD